ncbi:hypothetical protein TeGR_g8279 [Tetraparma gracilis]|uniref:Uncharacterized protein n=1 Tax=Tetraparma gracilis TaxID=2962635 RepID=A0ABQ6MGD4_9STRA|nr:hypothetical protein TeGR_g8279 [Tetraparma gracilis]
MASPNAYEQLRLSRIARNEARLLSLGLSTPAPPPPTKRPPPAKKRPAPPATPARRSTRVTGKPPVYNEAQAYRLLDEHDAGREPGERARGPEEPRKRLPALPAAAAPPAAAAERLSASGKTPAASAAGKVMARDLPLPLPAAAAALLGRALPATGKAAVVGRLAEIAGRGGEVGFSKYSGVLEFKGAAVLWVNWDATPGREK